MGSEMCIRDSIHTDESAMRVPAPLLRKRGKGMNSAQTQQINSMDTRGLRRNALDKILTRTCPPCGATAFYDNFNIVAQACCCCSHRICAIIVVSINRPAKPLVLFLTQGDQRGSKTTERRDRECRSRREGGQKEEAACSSFP